MGAKRGFRAWMLLPVALPVACCVAAGFFAARGGGGDYAVLPGREPPGTCAVEGYLRGDAPGGRATVTVVLTWKDEVTREEGGGLFRVASVDGRFRVGGLRVTNPVSFAIAVQTDDGRGGAQHATLGGNVAWLYARSGDRLTNVRVDVASGLRFAGVVRDARTGAPLAGVRVNAGYQTYGRDGWSRPQEFALTDAQGAFALGGVQRARLTRAPGGAPAARATLWFYRAGYRVAEVPVALPAEGAVARVDAALEAD